MRLVKLKMKEKYVVIKQLVSRNGNKNRATMKLGISKRQINLAMSDEQINNIVNHEISIEASHPIGKKNKYFG